MVKHVRWQHNAALQDYGLLVNSASALVHIRSKLFHTFPPKQILEIDIILPSIALNWCQTDAAKSIYNMSQYI